MSSCESLKSCFPPRVQVTGRIQDELLQLGPQTHTYSRKAGPREARWVSRSLSVLPGVTQSRASVIQSLSHLWLCDPMDCSMPGFPVHHLLEFAQTHVHWVGDAIQPCHPLGSPSPPGFNLSQHQGLFQWVGSSYQVAEVLEFQLQHQSFQWIFRGIWQSHNWTPRCYVPLLFFFLAMLESMWDLNSPTGDQTGSLALKLRVLTNEPSGKSLQVYVKTHLWSLWDAGPLTSSPHQPTAVEWRTQSSSGKKAGKEDDKRPLQSAKGTQILRFHPGVKKGHGSLHVRTLGSVLNQDQLSLPDTSYFHWQSWWWTWFSYVETMRSLMSHPRTDQMCPHWPGRGRPFLSKWCPEVGQNLYIWLFCSPLEGQCVVIKTNKQTNKKQTLGAPLMVQWLRLQAPSTGGLGSIPGQETRSHMLQQKIPHVET